MWVKDGNGNWYMAGQEIIKACHSPEGRWAKDSSGSWILYDEIQGQETGVLKTNAPVVGKIDIDRAV